MTDFPEPLTPSGCDLRDFAFMPLDVVRLRDSDLAIQVSGEEFRCAVMLWCASWHQVPAASLPDDDVTLSALAGYGRAVAQWKLVRVNSLRGWIKCDDGRLYHPVVAGKAVDAWKAKLQQRWKTECARIKKHNQRHETNHAVPEFDEWMSLGCPQGQSLYVPRTDGDCPGDSGGQSPGTPANCPDVVPGETPSKGEGEGQGQGEENKNTVEPSGSTGGAPPLPPDPAKMTRDELWACGKSLLKNAGMPERQCGTFVGKLVKDYGAEIVVEAVRKSVLERPADPASFLKALCQRMAGERRAPNRQEALEAENFAAAKRWADGARA